MDVKFDMKKPCSTCPFVKNSQNEGAPDWFNDVIYGIMGGSLVHSCHRTDPKADGFVGTEEVQHCVGFLGMMKQETKVDCYSPQLDKALLERKLDWNDIPTQGIYTLREFLSVYKKKFHRMTKGYDALD